jgi:MFS superfamily sulfate permease-like transporter
VKLTTGRTIFCLQKHEAQFVYKEVQTYIKNGIELHKGDIVFDVGANIGLFILPRFTKAVPSPLVAIVVMTVAVIGLLECSTNSICTRCLKT